MSLLFERGVPSAVLCVLLFATAASAQQLVLNVEVPFDFVVNNTTLPPGEYEIERGLEMDMNEWVIREADAPTGTSVLFLSRPVGPSPASERNALTFARYGDQHFLDEFKLDIEGFRLVAGRSMLRAERAQPRPEIIRIQGTSRRR